MNLKDKAYNWSGYSDKVEHKYYYEDDLRLVVQEVIDEIRCLPNRDDQIRSQIKILDGGGVNKFQVISIIEKRFGFKRKGFDGDKVISPLPKFMQNNEEDEKRIRRHRQNEFSR